MRNSTEIAMFAYNRPDHFLQTFQALKRNSEFKSLTVHIFHDGRKNADDKNWQDMRELAEKLSNQEKNIKLHLSGRNKGLKEAIRNGLTESLRKADSVIVVEDDIVTSKSFLKYMLDGLKYYRNNKEVGSICAYNHPESLMKIPDNYSSDIYFSLRTGSWGWATWADRWKNIDWNVKDFEVFKRDLKKRREFSSWGDDLFEMLSAQMRGKINTWDIIWTYHCFKNNLYTVYPVKSFVNNIGNDDTGINSKSSNRKLFENSKLNESKRMKFIKTPLIHKQIQEAFRKVYRRDLNYYKRKILSKLKLK